MLSSLNFRLRVETEKVVNKVVIQVAIRLNIDVDEATFDLLAEGKGISSSEGAAKIVLSTWADKQQKLFMQREMARIRERTPVLAARSGV